MLLYSGNPDHLRIPKVKDSGERFQPAKRRCSKDSGERFQPAKRRSIESTSGSLRTRPSFIGKE
ncbi:hypothetical protein [Bradyrhizobium elkanii]|uniref:hypothetical protein n=1 Tax=Bradyrhizobium elkanii TaxID=29448 RepID=UPI0035132EE6